MSEWAPLTLQWRLWQLWRQQWGPLKQGWLQVPGQGRLQVLGQARGRKM